jgi:hypothetical protein
MRLFARVLFGAVVAMSTMTPRTAAQTTAQIMPIVDHIPLNVPDQAKGVEWYPKQKFGGDPARLEDRLDGLRDSGVWRLVQRGDATPGEGHAIDHIGWRTNNHDAKTIELNGQNVTFMTEPRRCSWRAERPCSSHTSEGPASLHVLRGAKIRQIPLTLPVKNSI